MHVTIAPFMLSCHAAHSWVHKCHSWIALLVVTLHWEPAWSFLALWSLRLSEEYPALGFCHLCSESSAIGGLPSTSGEHPRAITVSNLYLVSPLDNPDQQLKGGHLTPAVGISIPWFVARGGALSADIGKFHLNYLCVFIHQLKCILGG